jgi:hypothetical protein
MPFDDDVRGKDFRADPEYYAPPTAVRIIVTCTSQPELGEQVLELPATTLEHQAELRSNATRGEIDHG